MGGKLAWSRGPSLACVSALPTAAGVACADAVSVPGESVVLEAVADGSADGRRKITARPMRTAAPPTSSMGLTPDFFDARGPLEDGPPGSDGRDGGFWPLDEDAFPIAPHSIAFARPCTPGGPDGRIA